MDGKEKKEKQNHPKPLTNKWSNQKACADFNQASCCWDKFKS